MSPMFGKTDGSSPVKDAVKESLKPPGKQIEVAKMALEISPGVYKWRDSVGNEVTGKNLPDGYTLEVSGTDDK